MDRIIIFVICDWWVFIGIKESIRFKKILIKFLQLRVLNFLLEFEYAKPNPPPSLFVVSGRL